MDDIMSGEFSSTMMKDWEKDDVDLLGVAGRYRKNAF